MKRLLFSFSVLAILAAVVFSGCQAFLEDYSYSPLGSTSSGNP